MSKVTCKYMRVGYGDGEGKTRPHPAPLPCLGDTFSSHTKVTDTYY